MKKLAFSYKIRIFFIVSFYIIFMAGAVFCSVAAIASDELPPIPNSEVGYSGASTTKPFVAITPYVLKIQGTDVPVPLWGATRRHDFGGNAPFLSPNTGKADIAQISAWDPVFAKSFTPNLTGSYDLNVENISSIGFPGRVEKRKTTNGDAVTMLRYNAGDGVTYGKCRTQLISFPIPPRTHAKWELEVAFGNEDGINDWKLSRSGDSPVLFWQIHSNNQTNPPLSANVDTDSNDSTKLMINFYQRVGTATKPARIGTVHGIERNTMVKIVVDTFLDERLVENGGKGVLRIWVDNSLAVNKKGPTLAIGPSYHWWAMDMYLWNESLPYRYTRASFWKTAKMFIFPK